MKDTPSIRETIGTTYKRDTWSDLLKTLFPSGALVLLRQPQALNASHEKVTDTLQLGTVTLPGDDEKIALLEITTTDQVNLAQNRVTLRNFVASFIDQANASAVLAVFRQDKCPDWRLTYAARKTTLDLDTFEISSVETAPKRFTFLLGPNEPCKTAEERLAEIRKFRDSLTLEKVERAFSVEKLSKEFFDKYNSHYEAFLFELLSLERANDTRSRFNIAIVDGSEAQSIADKPIRDFTKKLLGRLIFLHFLQKKGWMHYTRHNPDWSGGDKDFLLTYLALAQSQANSQKFHSAYLAPLFFQALNTERNEDLFTLNLPSGKSFTGRIPYLNGGLFDPDPESLQSLDFPIELFEKLLNFFAEYNFTIDEHDPEDHEVGIDPEMLGHIFENLLEDNKDKGAYYTPKVIVAYMCRQSLLYYLQHHLGENKALSRLVENHDPGDLTDKSNWCTANAKKNR